MDLWLASGGRKVGTVYVDNDVTWFNWEKMFDALQGSVKGLFAFDGFEGKRNEEFYEMSRTLTGQRLSLRDRQQSTITSQNKILTYDNQPKPATTKRYH